MLHTLKLLIPALVPSWRFFDIIAPSPRVQFTLLSAEDEEPQSWHTFRPRPANLSFIQMLGRMLWNPHWNESLFIASCAERLMETPTEHSENEIMQRILCDLASGVISNDSPEVSHLQFRLLVVERHGDRLQEDPVYYSHVEPIPRQDAV